jgi:hypothetical protein
LAIRIFFVLQPPGGVFGDVFPDAVHFGIIAEYVFVIITMPDGDAGGVSMDIDAFCYGRFERPNNGA